METIDFYKFLLKIKQQNGWKNVISYKRKTTHHNKIKLIINTK